jgi:hypothetical protein
MAQITAAETSESGEYILRRIPGWMPTNRDSGNFKLLDTVGHAIDRLDEDIDSLDIATTVQEAETVDQLERFAELVDLKPKQGEGKEKYRSRLISEFQQMTNEGTTRELIENTATILDVEPEKIGYEKTAHGVIELTVPGNSLDSLAISSSEFVTITGEMIAAGFNLSAVRRGTFTYITPTKYNAGNHEAEKGYDGLDSNGEPKDNGGTYAGLIN